VKVGDLVKFKLAVEGSKTYGIIYEEQQNLSLFCSGNEKLFFVYWMGLGKGSWPFYDYQLRIISSAPEL